MLVETKLCADAVDGHEAEELHDDGKHHDDSVVKNAIAKDSGMDVDVVDLPRVEQDLEGRRIACVKHFHCVGAVDTVVCDTGRLSQSLKTRLQVAFGRCGVSGLVPDVGHDIRGIIKSSGSISAKCYRQAF